MTSSDRAQDLAHELVHAYERQAKLYVSVLALSEAQREHIRTGADIRKIVRGVKRKQHLLDAIADVESRIGPRRTEWLALPQPQRAAADARLDRLRHEIRRSMDRILRAERASETQLAQTMARSAGELSKLNAASKAAQAYRPRGARLAPRFMDRTR